MRRNTRMLPDPQDQANKKKMKLSKSFSSPRPLKRPMHQGCRISQRVCDTLSRRVWQSLSSCASTIAATSGVVAPVYPTKGRRQSLPECPAVGPSGSVVVRWSSSERVLVSRGFFARRSWSGPPAAGGGLRLSRLREAFEGLCVDEKKMIGNSLVRRDVVALI